jgi:probable phosphoglycerate mutase
MIFYINTDGGSRGNPGKSACAFVVTDESTNLVFQQGLYLGIKTNNEAEYLGVLSSLKWLKTASLLPSRLIYRLDSKLVVEQLSGRWKIKDARMKILCQECFVFLKELGLPVEFVHIPREENAAADALVNQVLDQK